MKTATFNSLRLESGDTLSPVTIAWSHYGPEPSQARAVIVLLHGITSSPQAMAISNHQVAGLTERPSLPRDQTPSFPDQGWFDAWIGPGKVFDTAKDCILVPNALGSCFGSSGPDSHGSPALFPKITIRDTVNFYGMWLETLGIKKLAAVAGYSYGGYQAFQWALQAPVATDKVIALASAPQGNGSSIDIERLRALAARLDAGDKEAAGQWVTMRIETLKRYGYADSLSDSSCADIPLRLTTEATLWAHRFSPWSLACLRAASVDFTISRQLASARQIPPLLWLKCASDVLFPCGFDELESNPMIQGHCIQGKYGHASPMVESKLWTGHVATFLDRY